MLKGDQIDALRDTLEIMVEPINEYLLADIARRIADAGQVTSTSRYKAQIARMLGVDYKKIENYLKRKIGALNVDINDLFEEVAEKAYTQSTGLFSYNNLLTIVNECAQLATDGLNNITRTMGMIDPFGNPLPLRDAYTSACDFAFNKVWTGAQDYNSAIRDAVKNLTARGLVTIDYESGRATSLDAAVRRSVFGGMGLLVEGVEQQAHDDIGADGWEITAHEACAKDHEDIQGRQYTDAEYKALNDSLVRRIGTLNCKHTAFPIIIGVNEPQYTAKQLQEMKARNADGIVYEGTHYTKYEATQKQRQIERAIRQSKRQIVAYESAGLDEELANARGRYRTLTQIYNDFSNAASLKTQDARLEVLGYKPKHA